MRAVGSLKQLRSTMFNEYRERAQEDPQLVRLSNSKLMMAPGTAPTDSVMNEQFVRGLEATFRKYAGADENAPPGTTLTLDANELREVLRIETLGPIQTLALDADGALCVTGGNAKVVQLWGVDAAMTKVEARRCMTTRNPTWSRTWTGTRTQT